MALFLPLRINEMTFKVRLLGLPPVTEVDPDFREPVGGNKVRGVEILVKGQLARGTESFFRMNPTQTGNSLQSSGAPAQVLHVVFRPRDCETAGLVDPYFKPGDMIVSMAMEADERQLNMVVTSCRKGSGLKSQGRWLLVHVDAESDRDKLGSL